MKAVIDLETGGFSITKNAICEIGILIVTDTHELVEEASYIIKPYTRANDTDELVSYKEDAMAVNGILMEEILNGMEISEVVNSIALQLTRHQVHTLIGHNLRKFDFPRLSYLLERFAGISIDHMAIEDTLELCREHLNLDCNKLPSICEHFGIVHQDSHRALGDCKATLEVYKQFIPTH